MASGRGCTLKQTCHGPQEGREAEAEAKQLCLSNEDRGAAGGPSETRGSGRCVGAGTVWGALREGWGPHPRGWEQGAEASVGGKCALDGGGGVWVCGVSGWEAAVCCLQLRAGCSHPVPHSSEKDEEEVVGFAARAKPSSSQHRVGTG